MRRSAYALVVGDVEADDQRTDRFQAACQRVGARVPTAIVGKQDHDAGGLARMAVDAGHLARSGFRSSDTRIAPPAGGDCAAAGAGAGRRAVAAAAAPASSSRRRPPPPGGRDERRAAAPPAPGAPGAAPEAKRSSCPPVACASCRDAVGQRGVGAVESDASPGRKPPCRACRISVHRLSCSSLPVEAEDRFAAQLGQLGEHRLVAGVAGAQLQSVRWNWKPGGGGSAPSSASRRMRAWRSAARRLAMKGSTSAPSE